MFNTSKLVAFSRDKGERGKEKENKRFFHVANYVDDSRGLSERTENARARTHQYSLSVQHIAAYSPCTIRETQGFRAKKREEDRLSNWSFSSERAIAVPPSHNVRHDSRPTTHTSKQKWQPAFVLAARRRAVSRAN